MKYLTSFFLALVVSIAPAAAQTVPSGFFGAEVFTPATTLPLKLPVSIIRYTPHWDVLEASKGVYSFTTNLDPGVNAIGASGASVIWTGSSTPGWANSNAGAAVPPTNFQDYYDFVTALVTHEVAQAAAGHPKITYYEPWDEMNQSTLWSGTQAQMLTLAQNFYSIVKAIDPSAIVLTPSVADSSGYAYMQTYLAAGGNAYADVLNYHGYPVVYSTLTSQATTPPEQTGNIAQFYANLQSLYMSGKPVFVDEGSNNGYPVNSPAYVELYQLFLAANNVSNFIWYLYDGTTSTTPNWSTLNVVNRNELGPDGVAYKIAESWLSGATITSPPTRTANSNVLPNQTTSGAVVGVIGSGGAVPTNWTVLNNDSSLGIGTQVVAIGTENGLPYIDFRVFGTATAGAGGTAVLQFPYGSGSPGYWTASVYVKQTPSSTFTGMTTAAFSLVEANSSFSQVLADFFYYVTPLSGVALSSSQQFFSAPTTIPTVVNLIPEMKVSYTVGTPIDVTLRIAVPALDNGSVWSASITKPGGYQGQIVWDAAGGPTSYTPSGTYTWKRDLNGTPSLINTTVTLTAAPILLENQQWKGWLQ